MADLRSGQFMLHGRDIGNTNLNESQFSTVRTGNNAPKTHGGFPICRGVTIVKRETLSLRERASTMAEYVFPDVQSIKRAESMLSELGCYAADEDTLSVLTHCQDKAEVSFAVHFLSVPGWYCIDGRSFQSAHYRLTPRAQLGDDTVSFLLESRTSVYSSAIDVATTGIDFRGKEFDRRYERLKNHANIYLHFDTMDAYKWGENFRESLKAEFQEGSRTKDPRSPWHKGPLITRVEPGQFDWTTLSYEMRLARCRAWLGLKKISLPEHLIQVAANCETSPELAFAWPILQALSWKVPNRRTITDGVNEVHFQQKVGKERVDFLIGRLANKNEKPYAFDINNPINAHRKYAAELASEKAARAAGLRYERINNMEAHARGQFWARLLKEAKEEREVRNREVKRPFDPNRDWPPPPSP